MFEQRNGVDSIVRKGGGRLNELKLMQQFSNRESISSDLQR